MCGRCYNSSPHCHSVTLFYAVNGVLRSDGISCWSNVALKYSRIICAYLATTEYATRYKSKHLFTCLHANATLVIIIASYIGIYSPFYDVFYNVATFDNFSILNYQDRCLPFILSFILTAFELYMSKSTFMHACAGTYYYY